ncbi:MAG: sortase [Anaerolineae bacterium]|nr:sortase [Anaerolineae bacterium]
MVQILLFLSPVTAQDATAPRLIIPALRLSEFVGQFPLDGESWAIDSWDTSVGHLQGTATFNDLGNVALAAHAEMPDGTDGLFVNLHTLQPGMHIVVLNGDSESRYEIVKISSVTPEDLTPLYPSDDARLTLLTCDIPTYDPATGEYDRRVIVTAKRVGR